MSPATSFASALGCHARERLPWRALRPRAKLWRVSIVRWRSRALSYAPRVVVADTWLMARTHRLWTLLSLGSYQRVLRVDARRERIWLRQRRGWRSATRELGFADVDHIAYRFAPFVTQLLRRAVNH